MRRRIFSFIMAGVMIFSLSACGNDKKEDSAQITEESTVKVAIVTDTAGVNDGSFNESAWEGVSKAEDELGIKANYLESSTDADYIPNIEAFIEDEYDLIICVGEQLADAIKEESEAYPDVKFAIVDNSTIEADNVACLVFEQSQAAYLVGYVAGLTTESNCVGFVLGKSSASMNEFGYGYLAGVLDANPQARILQKNIDNFSDVEAGKQEANNMITMGADVIFHAAGGSGIGVINACKEAGIWAIGVDSDQSRIAPETILTSAMKRVDHACYDMVKAIKEDKFSSGVHLYSLEDEGVDIAPNTENLKPEVLNKIQEVKQKILSGEIEVPKTKEEFEMQYGSGIYLLEE